MTSRINAGEPMEIYSGSGGRLGVLSITCTISSVLVVDNYGAKTSKIIRVVHLLCVENFAGLEDIFAFVAL
ncbi:hypothetical protein LSPH24S_06402 [Lysinibacillus sphaericus]